MLNEWAALKEKMKEQENIFIQRFVDQVVIVILTFSQSHTKLSG